MVEAAAAEAQLCFRAVLQVAAGGAEGDATPVLGDASQTPLT